MSKTFKSDNELAKTISITRSQGRVLVEIEDPKHLIAINLSDNNAPALALAILEAAGVEARSIPSARIGTSEHLSDTAYELSTYIEKQQRATAEAKDQAELEAEALELFNTLQTEIHGNLGPNWVPVTEFPNIETKRKWLAVARKAREMRAEK